MKRAIVGVASPHKMVAENRAARRYRLLVRGMRIAETQAVAAKRAEGRSSSRISDALQEMARVAGIQSPAILSFEVERPRFASKKAVLALAEKISAPVQTARLALKSKTQSHWQWKQGPEPVSCSKISSLSFSYSYFFSVT